MAEMVTEPDVRGFQVLEEGWMDYELEDGTLVRMRPTLIFLLPGSKGEGPDFRVNTQIQSWSPPEARNPDGPRPPATEEELKEAAEGKPLKAALLSEGVSRYKTPAGNLTLKLSAKRFHRTGFYDENGQPVYLIQHSLDVESPKPPA